MLRTSRRDHAPSPKPRFTEETWLADLERVFAERGVKADGLSTYDVAQRKGWSLHRAGECLTAAWRRGVLECGRSSRLAKDGAMRPVPVYRLKVKAKGR